MLGRPKLAPTAESTHNGYRTRETWRRDDTLLCVRDQADGCARSVSRSDGWPPYLLIVDLGQVIEVYADFSGQRQGCIQFADGHRYRIPMDDLRDEDVRDRLCRIWTGS